MGTCQMFLLCTNSATLTVPHPILGEVKTCERCAKKLGYVAGSYASNMRESKELKARIRLEKRIVTFAIRELLGRGFAVSIDNGDEDWEVYQSTDEKLLLRHVMLTDEESVYASIPATGKMIGQMFFVYGNDGFDVLADYHCSLEPFITETCKLIESLTPA